MDGVFLPLQTIESTTITGIQILASVLTIFLGSIQLYDYITETDVYNNKSNRRISSTPKSKTVINKIQKQENIRYLTISLFSFVALSLSSAVDSFLILYISSVFIGIVLSNEYYKNTPDESFWVDFLLGHIFFVIIFIIVGLGANSETYSGTDILLFISFVFISAAMWFGLISIVKINC